MSTQTNSISDAEQELQCAENLLCTTHSTFTFILHPNPSHIQAMEVNDILDEVQHPSLGSQLSFGLVVLQPEPGQDKLGQCKPLIHFVEVLVQ